MRAGQLEVGERLLTDRAGTIEVASVDWLDGPRQVYNFEVAGDHYYLVGDAGGLSHNNDGCDKAARGLWEINRYEKKGQHPGVGTVYKDGEDLWVDLKGGHGGAEYKLYQRSGSKWKLRGSVDKHGDIMEQKHESGKYEVIRDKDIGWTGGN